MKYIKLFEEHIIEEKSKYGDSFKYDREEKVKSIMNLKNLPREYKEEACKFIQYVTHAKKGKVTGLSIHPELKKKIKGGKYPDGYDMGVDKDGWFIHTHRGRSKSHEKPSGITAKEMKFIDSTG
jgi:hypothetical protein